MNVVSFYAPRPEHPYFQDYRPFLKLLRLSCERFGHKHLVLTDDPMEVGGDDAYVVDLPRSLMKACIAAQAAYLADPAMADVPTLLTGADCVLGRDPSLMAEHDADIVITTCDAFLDCRMNCGTIFIRRPSVLAPVWAEALEHVGDDWGDDQTSVYLAICKASVRGLRVVEVSVDPYNLAPNHPADDCSRGVVLHFRGARKRWMVDYCKHWLDLGDGTTLHAKSNTSGEKVAENIRRNIRRGLVCVQKSEPHDGHAVLVGGGPSLESTLPEIRRRKEDGQTIFGLNGAARWLANHGVWPDYCVILDPRPQNDAFVGPASVHLIASQCDPAVFEACEGLQTRIWHFADPELWSEIAKMAVEGCLVGGGLTVGLTALPLAYVMGYRKIHLYGYDSSDADGSGHAYAQSETGAEKERLEAWVGHQNFFCSPAMFLQAKAFPELAERMAQEGAIITVHGEGLLPTIARQMSVAIALEEEMAA